MKNNSYTKKHLAFLRIKYMTLSIPPLTRAFNARFGFNRAESSIHAALHNHKIRCGRNTGKTKGVYRKFTPKQAAFIKRNYRHFSVVDLVAKLNEKFGIEITEQQIRSFTKNHHIRSGRTGCYEKGHVSWNNGTKGICRGNCTSFKKGHIPANIKPLGHERKDNRTDPTKGNYRHVKVAEPNPYTKAQTRYRLKHVVVWEQEHGPVPAGMIVTFKDGDEDNCGAENLMLITRAEHARLNQNGYRNAPAELKPSILALSKLQTKAGTLLRKQQEAG